VNIRLKTKIIERGLSQLRVARDAGVSDSYLSKVINGWLDPSNEIKARLASVVGCTVEEIFPQVNETVE
jgi:transcriptional regulator with XRE-family HTH domain